MTDDLYQEIILDHYRNPRGFRDLADEEVDAEADNPNCGDHIRVHVDREDGMLREIACDGSGCAICMASTSMMTERLAGRREDEADRQAAAFIAHMRGEAELAEDELEDLAALTGVKQYPMRIKCATLAWHALRKALGREAAD